MTRYISAETTMEQNYRNDERMDEMAIEDCLANHGVERISSSFHPPIMEDATNGSTVLNNFIVSENDNDDLEEPVMEATIQLAEPTLMTNGDVFVPIVFTTTLPKRQALIEGVNVVNIKRRTYYLIMGCFFLSTFVAVATAMMFTRWLVHSGNSNQTLVPLAPENNTSTLSLTGSIINKGNANWTIADAIIYDSKNGDGISLTVAESGLWLIKSVLNRTDINLTFFRISQAANIQRIDSSLISKFTLPIWNGHTVSRDYFSYHCSHCSVTTHITISILHSTDKCAEKCCH